MANVLANAGINAIIGMGTVFCVLILISIIIACFKVIPILTNMFEKKPETPAAAPAAAAPVAAPVASEDVPVAVIAAAIAAYEEATNGYTGGFVVRSIKRRR